VPCSVSRQGDAGQWFAHHASPQDACFGSPVLRLASTGRWYPMLALDSTSTGNLSLADPKSAPECSNRTSCTGNIKCDCWACFPLCIKDPLCLNELQERPNACKLLQYIDGTSRSEWFQHV
jgi:hypothetical protein